MHGESEETNRPRDEEAIVDEGETGPGGKRSSAPVPPPEPPTEVDAADPLDNFRKRARRELEEARRNGREDLLKSVLPVFDNIERAIQSAQRSGDVKAVADGLAMVQRQFVEALAREGITRVPTVGCPFDPSVHEAIQQVETADHAPGMVIAEVQPGYMQGDRLVRAAMVVVAKPKSDDGAPASGSAEAAS
jgi:molecular chaperone GrpE